MEFRTIHSFDSISIEPRTLVLCDIDDTLLRITEDPSAKSTYIQLYQHYFHMTKNAILAGKLADNEYYTLFPMQPTDAKGFERMLAKIRHTEGCELVFLTARSPTAIDFTVTNFRQIGLNPEDHIVHFSDTMPKGKYAKSHIDMRPYQKVVFIDDLRENLDSMRLNVAHPNLGLFLFQYRRSFFS